MVQGTWEIPCFALGHNVTWPYSGQMIIHTLPCFALGCNVTWPCSGQMITHTLPCFALGRNVTWPWAQCHMTRSQQGTQSLPSHAPAPSEGWGKRQWIVLWAILSGIYTIWHPIVAKFQHTHVNTQWIATHRCEGDRNTDVSMVIDAKISVRNTQLWAWW